MPSVMPVHVRDMQDCVSASGTRTLLQHTKYTLYPVYDTLT